ncbi:DNA-directed RNA polymerase subunit M [Brotonthovivens ammoniilytica]|uniref:DNA-directed RNA polymerase subunit M n=1 Tax=Brotonthovivens ammoniilytica TaxID=2981725 RepID=A0ABT2TLZ4_9FIRM|nr:DNA-directed RNA polymerase subunit M [Brotonthovivens ammoniilytica]MCU6763233.1 DNA-directed RNA polymerase subunit M [Brotonthovivens ammoniilytica]
MMKLYICPECGWIRTVSRRLDVECFKCGNQQMQPVKLSYERYISMTQKEREDYKNSWLYIHGQR